jgi:hypothetical protein
MTDRWSCCHRWLKQSGSSKRSCSNNFTTACRAPRVSGITAPTSNGRTSQFWPLIRIKRIFRSLEKRGLVIACQPESRKSRRKHYRIDYGKLDEIAAEGLTRARAARDQIDPIEGIKMIPSLHNDTDTKRDQHHRARTRTREGLKASAPGKALSPFVGKEGYQYQPKSKPDKAHIAQNLASNWGERPLAAHPKWPEFHTWCRRQRGKPNEKGFWTWLAGQPAYWRDKIKPLDEIQGYDLDGKFYEAARANELLAADPDKYVGRFRPAVRRDGKVQILPRSKQERR